MHSDIPRWHVESMVPMPARDSLVGGLDIVAYHRAENTLFFMFRYGHLTVGVTANLSNVPNTRGDPWFEARSEFEILRSAATMKRAINGYGKTEEDAILASVKLFLDSFEKTRRSRGPRDQANDHAARHNNESESRL